jgi:hypothetical protein
MGTFKTIMESIVIFAVSMIVLYVAYGLIGATRGVAAGIGWIHLKGAVLIGVGVLYLVFGLLLTGISMKR